MNLYFPLPAGVCKRWTGILSPCNSDKLHGEFYYVNGYEKNRQPKGLSQIEFAIPDSPANDMAPARKIQVAFEIMSVKKARGGMSHA